MHLELHYAENPAKTGTLRECEQIGKDVDRDRDKTDIWKYEWREEGNVGSKGK